MPLLTSRFWDAFRRHQIDKLCRYGTRALEKHTKHGYQTLVTHAQIAYAQITHAWTDYKMTAYKLNRPELPMPKHKLVADDKIEQRTGADRQAVGRQILEMQAAHQGSHQQ